MPSKSQSQHNLMAMVAHDPAAAKRLGIPQKVGKEFTAADKGRKFSKGGDMKESKEMMKKEIGFMKAKGAPKSMLKHEMAEMKGMKKGGSVAPSKMGAVKTAAPSRDGAVRQGHTKGKVIKMAGNKGMMRGGKC